MSAVKPRDLGLTYAEAIHGMQTGVAIDQEHNSKDGSPKHLRVGINSCMVTEAAVANLLIQKGIITIDEYLEAIRLQANEELARYEDHIERALGRKVTLR